MHGQADADVFEVVTTIGVVSECEQGTGNRERERRRDCVATVPNLLYRQPLESQSTFGFQCLCAILDLGRSDYISGHRVFAIGTSPYACIYLGLYLIRAKNQFFFTLRITILKVPRPPICGKRHYNIRRYSGMKIFYRYL